MKDLFTESADTIKAIIGNPIVASIIIAIVCAILCNVITSSIRGRIKQSSASKRSKTYAQLAVSIVRYGFILIATLMILQLNGVDVSSLLAGVGLLGAVIGLAAQDFLKDIIRGFSILSDSYYSVGDMVEYGDIVGRVSMLGFRTTKIKLPDESVVSIANRNIEQIKVLSKGFGLTIPLGYDLPQATADEIFKEATARINQLDSVISSDYLGVKELGDSAKQHLVFIKLSDSTQCGVVKRLALQEVLAVLDARKITIPYNQLDLHQK